MAKAEPNPRAANIAPAAFLKSAILIVGVYQRGGTLMYRCMFGIAVRLICHGSDSEHA